MRRWHVETHRTDRVGWLRAAVLGALGAVDLVVPFAEDTPLSLIQAMRPVSVWNPPLPSSVRTSTIWLRCIPGN